MPYKFVTYFLLLLVSTCIAQENAQPRVAPGIVECYRRADLFERDNRLPMTPSMLIELIRKVEDAPGSNQGMRQIATGLLHRFRQDGIIPAPGININQNDILRFSTNGFNFPKHRVLLSRLIQGNANQFPISNLTIQEQVRKLQNCKKMKRKQKENSNPLTKKFPFFLLLNSTPYSVHSIL